MQVVACVLLLSFSVVILQGQIIFPSFVQSDLIATYTVESYVPFYVQYDPPGSGSYSRFAPNGSDGIKMRFEGQAPDLKVVGEFDTGLSIYTETSRNELRNTVLMLSLNQTWEIWHHSFLGDEWTEALLTNCNHLGWGALSFEDLDEYGIWVTDLTNTSSDYSLAWNVTPGTVERTTIECLPTTPQSIGAGYTISLNGTEISISVLVSPQSYPFTLSYWFYNGTEPLNFHIFSSAPISEAPYRTEGVLLWFG